MNKVKGFLNGFFKKTSITLILIILFMAVSGLVLSGYGLYLGFSASILLGIFILFIQPIPLIFGFVMFFFEKNIAQDIVNYLTK